MKKRELDFYRDKTVVVYGASGGLGAALCFELCGRVATLILAGRSAEKLGALRLRLQEYLQAFCEAGLEATALQVWAVAGAVSGSAEAMADFAQRIAQSGADGLIVATGKTVYQSFCGDSGGQSSREAGVTHNWQAYEELLQVNLASVLQLAMALLPYFRQRKGFLHIAGSYASLFPFPYQAVYAASKAALLWSVSAVAREQQADFGKANVRGLLSISLFGGVATSMYYQTGLAAKFSKRFARFEKFAIAPPEKIAVGLLQGIARKRQIITIKASGFWVYHVVRRLPTSWLSYALLRAYCPEK